MALSSSSLLRHYQLHRAELSPRGICICGGVRGYVTGKHSCLIVQLFLLKLFFFSLSIALFVLSLSVRRWGLGCILHCKPEFLNQKCEQCRCLQIISSLELPRACIWQVIINSYLFLLWLAFSSQKASVFAKLGTLPGLFQASLLIHGSCKGQRDRRDSVKLETKVSYCQNSTFHRPLGQS